MQVENRRDCLKGVVVFIHKKLASKQGNYTVYTCTYTSTVCLQYFYSTVEPSYKGPQ